MLRFSLIVLLEVTLNTICLAQFSPPGLGKVNTAEWLAIGIKQALNKKETITSTTFLGTGRTSNPDNYNPFERSAIYVVNEEISHRFKKHWQYSFATSYRWQNNYKPTKPYEADTPKARQETRFYSRLSYLTSFERVGFSITYRPEIRLFYNPNFKLSPEATVFRSRLCAKVSFDINASKTNKLIASAEFLASTTTYRGWNQWKFKESRFCLYYSTTLHNNKIVFNLGYMYNLLLPSFIKDVHYLAFDICFKNPFS